MKTTLRGLTLTTMLMSASHFALADQPANSAIGDLPGYGEEAYFNEEAAYAVPDAVQAASQVSRVAEGEKLQSDVDPAASFTFTQAPLAPVKSTPPLL